METATNQMLLGSLIATREIEMQLQFKITLMLDNQVKES